MNAQDIILTYSKIYETMNLFSSIQLHQLRVAKVAKQIILETKKEVDVDKVVAAALLHDMGNMVKINFHTSLAKQFLRFDEHDADYWVKVKEDHIQKFGAYSHEATRNILKYLEIEDSIIKLIDNSSWEHIEQVIESDDWEVKILTYADYRITPDGVRSLDERLADLKRRYSNDEDFKTNEEESIKIDKLYHELEAQLVKAGLLTENVNDDSIAGLEI